MDRKKRQPFLLSSWNFRFHQLAYLWTSLAFLDVLELNAALRAFSPLECKNSSITQPRNDEAARFDQVTARLSALNP